MFCEQCGAKVNPEAHFCEACGHAVDGHAERSGPETDPPAAPHHFDQNDALAAAGVAAPLLGRGGGDIAGYMMSKAALENLEESGQGDSAMADMARTGLAISKFKIVASIVGFVIFVIIALVMWSNFQHAQSQFNNSPFLPTPGRLLAPMWGLP